MYLARTSFARLLVTQNMEVVRLNQSSIWASTLKHYSKGKVTACEGTSTPVNNHVQDHVTQFQAEFWVYLDKVEYARQEEKYKIFLHVLFRFY